MYQTNNPIIKHKVGLNNPTLCLMIAEFLSAGKYWLSLLETLLIRQYKRLKYLVYHGYVSQSERSANDVLLLFRHIES